MTAASPHHAHAPQMHRLLVRAAAAVPVALAARLPVRAAARVVPRFPTVVTSLLEPAAVAGSRAFTAAAAAGSAAGPAVPPAPDFGKLIVTPAAVRRLTAVRAKRMEEGLEHADKLNLRIVLEGGGCQGFQYRLALEHGDPKPEDVVIPAGPASVVVDGGYFESLQGSTVDYQEAMERSGFAVINNPNAASSCSCGSSFAPKD